MQAEVLTATTQQDSTDLSADTAVAEYIENASRYDGSRTSPQKIALIHALKREGRSVNAISEILAMDNRTVSAVLSRGELLVSDARNLLKANAIGFASDLVLASQEAAKRGKTEGIAAVLDRLGVTEPPKSQAQTQVGVQVVLHGGGIPEVSLAKVEGHSEGVLIQAGNTQGPISHLALTLDTPAAFSQQGQSTQALNATGVDAKVAHVVTTSQEDGLTATFVAESRK